MRMTVQESRSGQQAVFREKAVAQVNRALTGVRIWLPRSKTIIPTDLSLALSGPNEVGKRQVTRDPGLTIGRTQVK